MHGLYANIERWENEEDGDSSAQEDAASAAFALISSAAVPGAKMPTARPAIPRPPEYPQRNDLSDATTQGNATTDSTSTFGFSRTGSARSKASCRSSALASSRQSSGLESIPEQDDIEDMIAISARSFGSAITVPDDDSSEKIYEDLKRIRVQYGLDDDETTIAKSAENNGENPLKTSSDSAADIIDSLRYISARYGLDLLEGGKDEKLKKKMMNLPFIIDDKHSTVGSTSTDEKRSNATSQLKKSNSQSTKATNRTQQSVRFADDYATRSKDKEECELNSQADSEDSFLRWKMSVKSMYSEISKNSQTEEKDSAIEGAASTLLGAFREDSGLTAGVSEGTSKISDNDPVLNAFVASTNSRASQHSFSSTSAVHTANTNSLIKALTQEQRESGTTRSSSRPTSSSIFCSSSTTRGSSSNPSTSIFHLSPAAQLQPGWDSCPPRPSLKGSTKQASSGTLTNAHSSAAVASGFASSNSNTTGKRSTSTSNNYQSSFGTVSDPLSYRAVCASKSGEKQSGSTETRSIPEDHGHRTDDTKKESVPPNVDSTPFDPFASSKERMGVRARARARTRSASTDEEMAPLRHEGFLVSPHKMPRRYSDSSVSTHVGAGSGGRDDNDMDSLFASVKRSFAKGKGTSGEFS